MEQHTVRVGDQLLGYELLPGNQPPVVFVPGMAWSTVDFHPLIEGLGRNNVYAVDLRGHGRSGWARDYSFSLDADVGAVGLVEEYHERGDDMESLTSALGAFPYGEDSTWLEKIGPNASFAGPDLTADETCQRAAGLLHVAYGDLRDFLTRNNL